MPFFTSRKPEEEEVVHEEPPAPAEKKHHGMGLFGSRHSSNRSPSPVSSAHTRGSSSISSSDNGHNGGGASRHRSVLSRFGAGPGSGAANAELDPSIQAARERVMGAEQAEAEADRALAAARLRVREARDEVPLSFLSPFNASAHRMRTNWAYSCT